MASLRNYAEIDALIDSTAGRAPFGDFVSQLREFIVQQTDIRKAMNRTTKIFFFNEYGRKGFVTCKLVMNGMKIFAQGQDGEVLNITHAAIGSVDPTTPEGTDTKDVLPRLCQALLDETPPSVQGIRIEAILDDTWYDRLGGIGSDGADAFSWTDPMGQHARLLLKPPTGGRKSKRQFRKRSSRKRRFPKFAKY